MNNSDNESAQSALNIDLPDYPASDCSPDLKKQASKSNFDSPVQQGSNGESTKQSGNSLDSPNQVGNCMGSPAQAGNSVASWESPVLGESVSMYEAEQMKEVYSDILSKVNKLLAEPEPTREEPELHIAKDRESFVTGIFFNFNIIILLSLIIFNLKINPLLDNDYSLIYFRLFCFQRKYPSKW